MDVNLLCEALGEILSHIGLSVVCTEILMIMISVSWWNFPVRFCLKSHARVWYNIILEDFLLMILKSQ